MSKQEIKMRWKAAPMRDMYCIGYEMYSSDYPDTTRSQEGPPENLAEQNKYFSESRRAYLGKPIKGT